VGLEDTLSIIKIISILGKFKQEVIEDFHKETNYEKSTLN